LRWGAGTGNRRRHQNFVAAPSPDSRRSPKSQQIGGAGGLLTAGQDPVWGYSVLLDRCPADPQDWLRDLLPAVCRSPRPGLLTGLADEMTG